MSKPRVVGGTPHDGGGLGVTFDEGNSPAAIDLATEWRTDVFRIIEAAPDPAAARRSLRELLQVSESGANAVLAMQLRRLTTSERDALRADVEALRHEHRQLSGRPPDDH